MTVVKELLRLSRRDCCILFFLNPSCALSLHLALETISVHVDRGLCHMDHCSTQQGLHG